MPRFPNINQDQTPYGVLPRRVVLGNSFIPSDSDRQPSPSAPQFPSAPDPMRIRPRRRYFNKPASQNSLFESFVSSDLFENGIDNIQPLIVRPRPVMAGLDGKAGTAYAPPRGLSSEIGLANSPLTGGDLRAHMPGRRRPYSHSSTKPKTSLAPLPGLIAPIKATPIKATPMANSRAYPAQAGEWRNYSPTVQERAKYLIADGLRKIGISSYQANRRASKLTNLLEFTPIGDAADIGEAMRNPNWSNLIIAAAAGIPGANDALKLALRAADKTRRARIAKGARIPGYVRPPSTRAEIIEEIQHVMNTRKSSRGKLFNEHLGEYTIDYGVPGNAKDNFKGGWGLSHIIAKHTAVDGIDGEQYVLNELAEILANPKLYGFWRNNKDRRVIFENKSNRSIFRRYRYGKIPMVEDWLVSAYPKW